MKFEEYKAALRKECSKARRDPKYRENAHKLLEDAAKDPEVKLDEFGELADIFYGR